LTLTIGSGIAYYVTEVLEKRYKAQPEAATQLPHVVPSLDLEAATARLRQCEDVGRVGGRTFHRVRLDSNSPVEDDYIEGTAPGPGGEAWEFWGVFDGHVCVTLSLRSNLFIEAGLGKIDDLCRGSATSILLRQALIPHVSNSLQPLTPSASTNAIVASIKQAFLSIDKKIFKAAEAALESTTPSPSVIAAIAPAYAGSCALLSLYNPRTSLLLTACVGDSRAVLGRYDSATSTYTCEPLSIDQTGRNPKELARVRAAHPDEPDCIKEDTGRVLGLAVTRAFGDSR
jgi:pyruvate dehydrogenase phosphatase